MPEKTNPAYCHVVAGENTQAPQHQSSMTALIKGQAPPSFFQPRPRQQAAPPTGLLSGLPSSSASPQDMRCPSLLTKAAGLTSSSRSRSTGCHQHLRTSNFETDFHSLVMLVARLFWPWIITPGSILTASGICGMSKMSLAKPCSSRSS